jgi:hypothetical protein
MRKIRGYCPENKYYFDSPQTRRGGTGQEHKEIAACILPKLLDNYRELPKDDPAKERALDQKLDLLQAIGEQMLISA